MPRLFLATALALTFASVGYAAEAVITVPEVEVRSGPSMEFYPTGKLKQGDRVQVEGEKNGFLMILPPEGSFSLIPKDQVKMQPGNTGVVTENNVETVVGSTLASANNVRGAKLNQGQIVIVQEETTLGGKAHYKIRPANEHRYIPGDAVKAAEVQLAGATGPAPALARPAQPATAADHQVADCLQRADEAYRKAEASGHWADAKKLYEELARCPNHEARMIAWNRLEFIRKKSQMAVASANSYQGPLAPAARVTTMSAANLTSRNNPVPAAPAAAATPPPRATMLPPRATSSYTYTTDNGAARPAPAVPAVPAPAAQANQSRYIPAAPTITANVQASGPGRLRRARHTADGRPLYLLEGSRGDLLCYVASSGGLNLEPFLHQIVELRGGPMVYRSDLRGNFLMAVQVIPVGN